MSRRSVTAARPGRLPSWNRLVLLFLVTIGLLGLATTVASLFRGDSSALIVSDGKAYYAWARSVVLDRDLDFENDYRLLYPPDPLPGEMTGKRTGSGRVINKYPVGLALMETPGLLLGHSVAIASGRWAADGVSTPYQVGVVLTLMLLYLAGVYLFFTAMVRLGVERSWSALLSMAMVLSTNLLHYIAKEPAMPHAAGLSLFAVLAWLVSRWDGEWRDVHMGERIACGLLIGLLILVRNSNVLLAPMIAWLIVRNRGLSISGIFPIASAAGVTFMLQPIALYLLWGDLKPVGYAEEGFTSGWMGVLQVLFSGRHGLFVYHPWYLALILVNVIGLSRRSLRATATAALLTFALFAVLNGHWWCWWFGSSFGSRPFIEALAPLSMGAGLILSKLCAGRRKCFIIVSAGIALLVALNVILWAGYLLQRYPHDGTHTVAEAYLWPAERLFSQ